MAGREKRRQDILTTLARLAAEALGDDATIPDYVVDWLQSGGTLLALAERVGAEIRPEPRPVSRATMTAAIYRAYPELRAELQAQEHREQVADAHADRALAAAEDGQHHLARAHQWTAAAFAPDRYAAQKAPSVQVLNVAELHLAALKAPAPAAPALASSTESNQ